MSYSELEEVIDGMAEQKAYVEIIEPGTEGVPREELRIKLLIYCKLDTRAMIFITRLLQGK